jgi:hypothetical protein
VRAFVRGEAARRSHLLFVDQRAVRELGHLFAARLRCPSLRCTAETLGFRRADEWVDWGDAKVRCQKCGRRPLRLRDERYVEIEMNAAVKVVRFRPVDPESLEALPDAPWEYAPFEMGGSIGELAGK